MQSLNKVTLIGHLGKAPEGILLKDGTQASKISIATTKRWTDKNTGVQKEETEWHRIVFYRRVAEIANHYLRAGSLVYIEGQIKTRTYVDKEGATKSITEIVADELIILSKNEGNDSAGKSPPAWPQTEVKKTTDPRLTGLYPPAMSVPFDDDIPF